MTIVSVLKAHLDGLGVSSHMCNAVVDMFSRVASYYVRVDEFVGL